MSEIKFGGSSGGNNPYAAALLGPDVMQKQYQIQQNQRMADALMAQSLAPQEQGQMVSGHYVGSSPLNGLAQMLKGYAAAKTMRDMPSQQAELAAMQGQQLDSMLGMSPPSQEQANTASLAAGGQGPTTQAAAQANQFAGGGPSPLVPTGADPRQVKNMVMWGGPQMLGQLLMDNMKTTDVMKNANWQGRSAIEMRDAARGKDRADSAITGGNTYWNADGTQGVAPDFKTGLGGGFDANGRPIAAPIQGWGAANAGIKGAEAGAVSGAQANNKLVQTTTGPNQTPEFKTEGQVIADVTGGKQIPAGPDSKTLNAGDIENYIEQANQLLGNASNGTINSAVTGGKELFGISSDASKADAQLKVISGNLVLKQPRMEGPQSDADRLLYQSMAADVANSSKPVETRQAALKTLKELNSKYLPKQDQKPAAASGAPDRSILEAEARRRGLIK